MAATYWMHLNDKFGANPSGRLVGISGVHFTPRGGTLSGAGTITFRLPLSDRHNYTIAPDMQIEIFSAALGGASEGKFVITEKSETITEDGHWAEFTCPDQLEELRWAMVPGYATASGEPAATTAQNLLSYQTETPWVAEIVGTIGATAFTCDRISGQQAIGKFCSERFLSYKLNPTIERHVRIGQFGDVDSGIRLTKVSKSPDEMTNPNIVPIDSFAPRSDATGVINCVSPTGAGDGVAALTLEPLFNTVGMTTVVVANQTWQRSGTVAFVGFDANLPLYRRRRGDRDLVADGRLAFDYFIADTTSLAAHRMRWLPYDHKQITPVSASLGDWQQAAQALYSDARGYLLTHNDANDFFEVTTDGRCDVRGIAGKLVTVVWTQTDADIETRKTNATYQVVDVHRTIDDHTGASTLAWKLSSKGRDVASDASLVVGMIESIDYQRVTPQIYILPERYSERDYVDASNPTSFVMYADPGMIKRLSANLIVELIPMVATAKTAKSKDHQHDVTIPSLSVSVNVSGSASITAWDGVTVTIDDWSKTKSSVTDWGTASAKLDNWSSVSVSISSWAGAYITIPPSGWAAVTATANSDFTIKQFAQPAVPGHDNAANHGTSINNPGAHSHAVGSGAGGDPRALTDIFIDPKGRVATPAAGTAFPAFTSTSSYNWACSAANITTQPTVAGQGSATIGQFGTSGGGFTLGGTATGSIDGTAGGDLHGTATIPSSGFSGNAFSTLSGTANGALSGSATGKITGTGTGSASGSGGGSTASQAFTVTTGTGGAHSHDLEYGIFKGPTPTSVSVTVDGTLVTTVPLTVKTTIDLMPYVNDESDHTVTISGASLGGVRWTFIGRCLATTVRIA